MAGPSLSISSNILYYVFLRLTGEDSKEHSLKKTKTKKRPYHKLFWKPFIRFKSSLLCFRNARPKSLGAGGACCVVLWLLAINPISGVGFVPTCTSMLAAVRLIPLSSTPVNQGKA